MGKLEIVYLPPGELTPYENNTRKHAPDDIEAINRAIYFGTAGKAKVIAPFIKKTKADIVAEGIALKVPYELTWSCYSGGERPCGKCGTCIDRAKAFEMNGVIDPL